MSKIGIVTVYYTENVGSVLQATALQEVLHSFGFDVYFISTRNKYSAHSKKNLLKSVLKVIKNRANIVHCFERYFYFEKYIKQVFTSLNANQVKEEGIECLVIGSDTVWDINSKYFLKSSELFWGTKWDNSIPIITYAASIANSCYDKLDAFKYSADGLRKIKQIGVRDNYTKSYVERIVGRDTVLNCDPTLLLDFDFYRKKCHKINGKYILIYLFEDLAEELCVKLKIFAKEKGLKIICVGKYIEGSHEWKPSTIENFLSYFYFAEYIVTNTFHGTVFSVIFNKVFISLDFNKVKVRELLHSLGLENRLVKDDIDVLIKEEIDYKTVNQKLEQMRYVSRSYLYKAINECI